MPLWAYIENIALFGLVGFLCWLFDSGWPLLALIFVNYQSKG